jgi:hypothetical protein
MESKKSKTYKLDIFKVFKKIKKNNIKYWKTLTEDEQKGFSPVVIIRWLSSNTPIELIYLNELVNPYIIPFAKTSENPGHNGLIYNLMTMSTENDGNDYRYVKRINDLKFPISTKLLGEYLNYSIRETKPVLQFYTNDDIVEICNDLGYQKDTLSNIKKELKNRNV